MNTNKKLIAALLVGSIVLSTPVMAVTKTKTYKPQYSGYSKPSVQKTYPTAPGANYSLQDASYGSQNYLPPLQGRVITVPMGEQISAVASNSISSEFVTVGDSIYLSLPSGYYFNGTMVLPPNTSIQGDVVVADKAGRAGKNGQLKIKFTSAVTPNGQRIPISGKIATEDRTGILKGGTGMERATGVAKNAALGAGLGALSGVVFGPLSGGRAGRGAALGTAVGGGLGLGKSIIDKGSDIEIPANSRVDVVIDQPMVVNPAQGYSY